MSLSLEVENGNRFDLRGSKLQLGLDVKGSHLGDVEYDNAFSLERGGTTSLTLPMRFTWSGLESGRAYGAQQRRSAVSDEGTGCARHTFRQTEVAFACEGRAPLVRSGGITSIPAS